MAPLSRSVVFTIGLAIFAAVVITAAFYEARAAPRQPVYGVESRDGCAVVRWDGRFVSIESCE